MTTEREVFVGSNNLEAYFNWINQYPLLAPRQEFLLFHYMKLGKTIDEVKEDTEFLSTISPKQVEQMRNVLFDSQSIRDMAVNCNLRFVIDRVKKICPKMPLEEKIQEGNKGLLRGVDKFDPYRGFKFVTYAGWWIRQAVTRAYQDGGYIRIPVYIHEALNKVYKLEEDFVNREGKEPTREEFMKLLEGQKFKTAVESIADVWFSGVMQVGSLNIVVGDDLELSDLIADKNSPDPQNGIAMLDNASILYSAMDEHLSAREKEILRLRFGLGGVGSHTLQEIANQLGITRERVRQIEAAALEKLGRGARLRKSVADIQSTGEVRNYQWIKDTGIWENLSAEEKTVLNIYSLPHSRRDAAIERVSKILNTKAWKLRIILRDLVNSYNLDPGEI